MSNGILNKKVRCPFCDAQFFTRAHYVDPIYVEKSSHQVAVEKFMLLGGQEVPEKPTIPSLEIRKLRAKLILEEARETIEALGLEIYIDGSAFLFTYENMTVEDAPWKPNLEKIVDGCCDLRVVTTGTLSACGVKDIRPQELVDENNLEKFRWTQDDINNTRYSDMDVTPMAGGFLRFKNKDGKIIKPPSHKPPSLDKELQRQLELKLKL